MASTFAINKNSGLPLKTIENNDGTSTLVVAASAAPPAVISSWTRELINISTSAIALAPDSGQVYIRIVPLSSGDFGYGPDSGINVSNCESFNKNNPIEIQISNTVYIFKHAATGNVVVYRGSA